MARKFLGQKIDQSDYQRVASLEEVSYDCLPPVIPFTSSKRCSTIKIKHRLSSVPSMLSYATNSDNSNRYSYQEFSNLPEIETIPLEFDPEEVFERIHTKREPSPLKDDFGEPLRRTVSETSLCQQIIGMYSVNRTDTRIASANTLESARAHMQAASAPDPRRMSSSSSVHIVTKQAEPFTLKDESETIPMTKRMSAPLMSVIKTKVRSVSVADLKNKLSTNKAKRASAPVMNSLNQVIDSLGALNTELKIHENKPLPVKPLHIDTPVLKPPISKKEAIPVTATMPSKKTTTTLPPIRSMLLPDLPELPANRCNKQRVVSLPMVNSSHYTLDPSKKQFSSYTPNTPQGMSSLPEVPSWKIEDIENISEESTDESSILDAGQEDTTSESASEYIVEYGHTKNDNFTSFDAPSTDSWRDVSRSSSYYSALPPPTPDTDFVYASSAHKSSLKHSSWTPYRRPRPPVLEGISSDSPKSMYTSAVNSPQTSVYFDAVENTFTEPIASGC